MIDPSIPLGVRPPQQSQPLALLGQLMQLRQDGLQNQERDQLNQQRQRLLDDDDATRDIVKKHVQLDPQGQPVGLNVDNVINDLNQLGKPNAAFAFQAKVLAARKEQAAGLKDMAEATRVNFQTASRMALGITDQASKDRIFPEIAKLIGPEMAAKFPQNYDKDTFDSLIKAGEGVTELLSQQRLAWEKAEAALKRASEAIQDQQKWEKEKPGILKDMVEAASMDLSLSRNEHDWDGGMTRLRAAVQGLPKEMQQNILGRFDDKFDAKDSAERARLAGMTMGQRVQEKEAKDRLQVERDRMVAEDESELSPAAAKSIAIGIAHGLTPTQAGLRGGIGKNAQKNWALVTNLTAEMFPNLDRASQIALYGTTKAALQQQTTQMANLDTYEGTALKNLKVLMDTAKGIIPGMEKGKPIFDSSVSWANKAMRDVDLKLLGSGEQAAFNAALHSVVPEFARIIQNFGASGGQVTDSMREDVKNMANGAYSYKQLYDAAQVLVQDAKNRKTSNQATIDGLFKIIQQAPAELKGEPGAPPASGGLKANWTGHVVQNGVTYEVTTDAAGKVISQKVVK